MSDTSIGEKVHVHVRIGPSCYRNSIYRIFSLVLYRNFEQILIKIGYFYEFLNLFEKPYAIYKACQLMKHVLLAHLAYFVGNPLHKLYYLYICI